MTEIGWRPGAGGESAGAARRGAAGAEGLVIWLTGRPASGKSTLAGILAGILAGRGRIVEVLDADDLRRVLTPRPDYSAGQRDWFYGVLTFLAGLLARHGITVLLAATAHRRAYRERARRSLRRFAEVYVKCPAGACRERDPKGLYARSRQGLTRTLPGEQEPYEEPEHPEAIADSERQTPAQTARSILDQLDRAGLLEPSPAAQSDPLFLR